MSASAVAAVLAAAVLHAVWNALAHGIEDRPSASAGLLARVFVGGRPRSHQLPALAAAAGTGVLIASYTIVDGPAVRHTDVLLYAGWLFLLQGPVIPALAVAVRGPRIIDQARPWWWLGVAGGAVSLLAYGLVLWAQQSGALAAIAALRETSIVVGALIGALFLGGRLGRGRALASAVVVLGVVLVNRG